MRRWGIVVLTILVPVVAIFLLWRGTRHTTPFSPVDEILAYELRPGDSVRVRLPGGIDEALLTTWAVLDHPVEPEARIPYAFDVELIDASGQTSSTRRFDEESRVSLALRSAAYDGQAFTSRLADSNDPVTDARTASVDVHSGAAGQTMRIRLASGSVHSVLLRAAYREPRGELERQAYERSLTVEERQRLVDGRSALGYDDLSPASVVAALGTWGRRLDADGEQDRDFRVRRLFLGSLRTAASPTATGEARGVTLSRRHSAAINVTGPVSLDVIASVSSDAGALRVARSGGGDVGIEAGTLTVSPIDGGVRVTDGLARPHTLVLSADTAADINAHVIVETKAAAAQIGEVLRLPAGGGRIELSPDVRIIRVAALSETPVVARVHPQETYLKVIARVELATNEETDQAVGALRVRFVGGTDGGVGEATWDVRAPQSKFDRIRTGGDATEPVVRLLSIPSGCDRVELRGDPRLRVALFADDTGIAEDVLRLPYQVNLVEDDAWRNAPYDVRRWVHVSPANYNELLEHGQLKELAAQVRIEPRDIGAPGSLPEMPLTPERTPIARHFLEHASFDAKHEAFPPDAWTPLPGGHAAVRIERAGARARKIDVHYIAGDDVLGKDVVASIDDRAVRAQRLVIRSGRFSFDLDPGPHEVMLSGLGRGGLAFADVPPAQSKAIVRRRVVHELTSETELAFALPPAADPRTFVLFAVSEVAGAWRVEYRVDDGRTPTAPGRVLRTATVPHGELSGGDPGTATGLLWEGLEAATSADGGNAPATVGKAKFRLGDDLAGRSHVVHVRLLRAPGPTLWVRAVLVGQTPPGPDQSVRGWVTEDE